MDLGLLKSKKSELYNVYQVVHLAKKKKKTNSNLTKYKITYRPINLILDHFFVDIFFFNYILCF